MKLTVKHETEERRGIWVTTKTKNKYKILANRLGYVSMGKLLGDIANVSFKRLEELLK